MPEKNEEGELPSRKDEVDDEDVSDCCLVGMVRELEPSLPRIAT